MSTTIIPKDQKRRNLWPRYIGARLTVVAFVMLVALIYSSGRLDPVLWKVGLNYTDCFQNGYGAVYCGDSLEQYRQNLRNAGFTTP